MSKGYIRKTQDVWLIQTYTGKQYGWEDVSCESTYREAKAVLKEYRLNQPMLQHRIKFARIPL